ncbi:hypothetical protein [Cellulomonas sp. URHE0023]|uniref:hypothetical protein n=1 Tax=Cellulomonas sp. URHE0023 TaxID=1380354 RepID=UPI000690030D|nr:hypothetical protein [Cellulomonas sp. URHE0023]
MTHTRRVAAVAAPAVMFALTLAACASAAGGTTSPTAMGPATADEIAIWTEYAGIAPDLVYVTEVDGFELWPMYVGVVGDDGMSVGYGRNDGSTVLLRIDRLADPSVAPCAELPDASEAVLRCSLERGDAYIVLEGEGVDPAVLRTAADSVRVPRADELSELFAELPTPMAPVERPDLEQGGEVQQSGPTPLGG